ncbi:MAG: hypothetical protein WCK28_12185 [Burkholderiales bacterium]|jgi:hypothetical protein
MTNDFTIQRTETPSTVRPTHHARARFRQRAIPSAAIDLVMAYGVQTRSHGATRIFLDRGARNRLTHDVGRSVVRELGHKLNIFLVVSDEGDLITAAYREKPIRH